MMIQDCTVPPSSSSILSAVVNIVAGGGSPTSLSMILLMGSLTLLTSTLIVATIFSDQGLSQLGLRPHGRNFWTWLYNYCLGSKARGGGMFGYDCIQGAMSPPLRVACHISATLMVWSMVVFVVGGLGGGSYGDHSSNKQQQPWGVSTPTFVSSSDQQYCEASTVVSSAFVATAIYGAVMYIIHHVLPSVSMPGGPRAHKIQRQPQWPGGGVKLPKQLVDGYQCLVADESHKATSDKFFIEISNGCGQLTGEAAGRQTWFKQETNLNIDEGNDAKSSNPRAGGGGGGPVQFLSSSLSNILGRGGGNDDDNGNIKKKSASVDENLVRSLARGGREDDYITTTATTTTGHQNEDDFVFVPSRNPNSNDQIFRAQQIRKYLSKPGAVAPDTTRKPKTVHEACRKAAHFYSMLQCDDGHWAADYGGPHFLMPGLVTAWYVMGKPTQLLDGDQIALLTHYILAHQQVDGGWGTHIESPSTMFGSTLMYVALRLMGTPADHPACVKGRDFLKEHGGALYTSSWSKFYLCLLGLMDWKGHNSVRKYIT